VRSTRRLHPALPDPAARGARPTNKPSDCNRPLPHRSELDGSVLPAARERYRMEAFLFGGVRQASGL
jgi:hypothetical protein